MDERSLRAEQLWFLAAVTGRDAGPVAPADAYIHPSDTLTPEGRLDIYRESYHARLEGALQVDFPAIHRLVGPAAFGSLSRAYVHAHPPSSWTLDDLGARLPSFLRRPFEAPLAACDCDDADGAPVAWPPSPAARRLLRDVARLEWAMTRAFAARLRAPIGPDDLRRVAPAALAAARLRVQPHLRVLALGHRASAIVTATRQDLPLPDLGPAPTHVAVYRRGTQVIRLDLGPTAAVLLLALREGLPVGDAVGRAAATWSGDAAGLPTALQRWFADWSGDGLFCGVD